MEIQDTPRIGNRRDALELLDQLLDKEGLDPDVGTALEALRDAIERFIL